MWLNKLLSTGGGARSRADEKRRNALADRIIECAEEAASFVAEWKPKLDEAWRDDSIESRESISKGGGHIDRHHLAMQRKMEEKFTEKYYTRFWQCISAAKKYAPIDSFHLQQMQGWQIETVPRILVEIAEHLRNPDPDWTPPEKVDRLKLQIKNLQKKIDKA